jgi:hypothetical protein
LSSDVAAGLVADRVGHPDCDACGRQQHVSEIVSVVVPAPVTVDVVPGMNTSAVRFALLSRSARVLAVEAVATPVPVGVPLMTGVGSVGVPVKVGDARSALRFSAAGCTAVSAVAPCAAVA